MTSIIRTKESEYENEFEQCFVANIIRKSYSHDESHETKLKTENQAPTYVTNVKKIDKNFQRYVLVSMLFSYLNFIGKSR